MINKINFYNTLNEARIHTVKLIFISDTYHILFAITSVVILHQSAIQRALSHQQYIIILIFTDNYSKYCNLRDVIHSNTKRNRFQSQRKSHVENALAGIRYNGTFTQCIASSKGKQFYVDLSN